MNNPHPLDRRKADNEALIAKFDATPAMKEQRSSSLLSDALDEAAGLVRRTEPEPLRRPLPPAEHYPLQSLGALLGEAAQRIHATLQAPPAMVGQSILAAASLAVQHLADVELDGRRELLSLWSLSVAESGERKSGVDSWALKAHREHEREALERCRIEQQEYAIALQAYDVASRNIAKGKEVDAIEHELRKLGASPEPPLKPLLLVGSPTIEGIHKQFVSGLPSLGLFHDDAGEFLGGHSMNKENRIKTASGLSKLWDVGEFDRIRAGDGAEKHYGKRLAAHLMLQPVIAETILSDDILTGQGFLARCLMTWPASTIGTRDYVPVNLSNDPAMLRYWRTMRELLAIKPQLRQDSRNELELRTLTLTPEAKQRWVAVYGVIESDMAARGTYASVRAWASKAGAQVQRIAGVLSLVDAPDTGLIQADAIDRAALLVNHYLSEAARIVGTHSVLKAVRNAEALRDWCQQSGIRLLHSQAAMQLGPNSIRDQQAFNAAIKELENTGWAIPIDGGALVDGKHRKRVWQMWEPAP